MAAKAVLLSCILALFAQCITSQCIGAAYNGLGLDGAPCTFATAEWAPGFDLGFAPSNGGGFAIRSISPIAVTGVSMTSENIYEGPLAVSGAMPFLGSVSLEGALPTIGAGAVAYGCGNGNVGMVSEDIAPGFNAYGPYGPGIIPELGYGYGAPLGYEAGIAGPYGYGYDRDCGYGPFY